MLAVCSLCDGELDICQSQAIMRYLGRKLVCYGASDADRAAIDEVLDGIVALRKFYLELIYTFQIARNLALLPAEPGTAARPACCRPSGFAKVIALALIDISRAMLVGTPGNHMKAG
jgi:hypothetical protein